MPSRKNILSVCFSALSLSYAWLLVSVYAPDTFGVPRELRLQALLTQQNISIEDVPWKTFDPTDLDKGVTLPAGTNVVFTIPPDSEEITREVLFTDAGKTVRYWGYCFDPDYDYTQSKTVAQSGFPGKMFLSEAERAWRTLREKAKKPLYTIFNPPTKEELGAMPVNGPIRHQVEKFKPGTTCYVMSEKTIPFGSDRDGDGLNAEMEKALKTDPESPDSDSDGIFDGVEALMLGTDPLRRDTDGDGLIDGLEDRGHDGNVDLGDTNPLKKDTDSDGLCDGYCRQFTENRICGDNVGRDCKELLYGRWMGEDKNLNGKLDSGETDPRLWSTTQDGISDMQTYYKCILAGGKNC